MSDGSKKERRYRSRSCAFLHDCIVNQSTNRSCIVDFGSIMTIVSASLRGDFANIITMIVCLRISRHSHVPIFPCQAYIIIHKMTETRFGKVLYKLLSPSVISVYKERYDYDFLFNKIRLRSRQQTNPNPNPLRSQVLSCVQESASNNQTSVMVVNVICYYSY